MRLCLQTKTWGYGAGWFAQELAVGLAEAGAEVIYVAPTAIPAEREPKHARLIRHVVHREREAGPRLIRALSSIRRVADGYLGCFLARRTTRNFVFTIPDPLPFFILLQLMLAAVGGRRFLIVHDAVPHTWVGRSKAPVLHWWALWLSYHLSTHIVATTQDCRDTLLTQFCVSPVCVTVVPHGAFDLGTPTPLPGKRHLLVFGGLRRNKRILESIQAVQTCRARGVYVALTIAGTTDESDPDYWPTCTAQIAVAPDGINLEIGYVEDSRIPELIATCDCVLLPYRDFTSASGVAILLTLSQRPMIATNSGGMRDLFASGAAGIPLVGEINSDTLAEAISKYCASPKEEWERKAAKGRERLLRELSWTAIGRGYLDIIRATGNADKH